MSKSKALAKYGPTVKFARGSQQAVISVNPACIVALADALAGRDDEVEILGEKITDLCDGKRELREENAKLADALAAAEKKNAEWEESFRLYDAACRRGCELWRKATGRADVLPDTAQLVAWLLAELDRLYEAAEPGCIGLDSVERDLERERVVTEALGVLAERRRLAREAGKGEE